MTLLEALEKLQELLWEDDDLMSQENLFEAQNLIDQLVEHFRKLRQNGGK